MMYAAGFSWKGATRFYHIPQNSKADTTTFVKKVLHPMLFVDLKKLWKGEIEGLDPF